MSTPARTEVRLAIRRSRNVSDGQGNSYGIIEVSPDQADPAIALAIRLGATGERLGRILRPGGRIDEEGLDLEVEGLSTQEPAWLVLTGTVPTKEGGR